MQHAAVVVLRDPAGTGRQAPAHLALQAGPRPGRETAFLAGPQAEDLLHHPDGFPDRAARGVGPEVEGAVVGKTPHKAQGRIGLLEVEAQAQKILVVPEPDVVPGGVLLDEGALQNQGFPGLGGKKKVHLDGLFQHQGGLGVLLFRGLEVGGQAVPEVDGLPDIEHPAAGVLEQIHPAAFGDAGHGLGQGGIGGSWALHRRQASYL